MNTRTKQLGLGIGLGLIVAVGYLATSGQYVPGGTGGGGTVTGTSGITCSGGNCSLNSTYSPTFAGLTLTGGPLIYPINTIASQSGLVNDLTFTGIATTIIARIPSTSIVDLTGLQGCTTNGRIMILVNTSTTNTIRVWNDDGRSSSGNKLYLGRDFLSIPPTEVAALQCDNTSSHWRLAAISFDPTGCNYGSTHCEMSDDMLNRAPAASGSPYNSFLTCFTSGAGATCGTTDNVGALGRPGIQQASVGTTSTGRTALTTSTSALDFSGASFVWRWVGGVAALSSATDGYALWSGFFHSTTNPDSDGCYVLYDERQVAAAPTTGSRPAAGSHTLSAVCASGGLKTQYPMDGVTVDDSGNATVAQTLSALTWPTTGVLSITIASRGTSEVDFEINGQWSAVIRTHIPNSIAHPFGAGESMVKSVGTTARTYDKDFVGLAWDLGTGRFP